METLIPATLFMIASHVVPGVPAIRSSLIEAMGRRAFLSTDFIQEATLRPPG